MKTTLRKMPGYAPASIEDVIRECEEDAAAGDLSSTLANLGALPLPAFLRCLWLAEEALLGRGAVHLE